ncbi:MAG TPA: carbon-nitrogen hydrolase family protein [Pedobacter sp.]|jgi:predicted amidohydrolase
MKIGVAQFEPIKGDIDANIVKHQQLIELASSLKADGVFFPELSLTGYEPELAEALATSQDDARFDVFEQTSNKLEIVIGLGVPTKGIDGIHISMIIFQPNKPRQTYSKQQLHSDELPYFTQGNTQVLLRIDDKVIAPSICYESLQIDHAENAVRLGAQIYIASVAKPQNGYEKALIHYPAIAKQHSMAVLMANCIGYCDNFESVGKSSVWNKEGMLLHQLDSNSEAVLVFDTENEEVVVMNLNP